MRRSVLATLLTCVASLLVATSGAQAVVVNDSGTHAGVALEPGTRASLPSGDIVTSSAPCKDPALPPDLTLPNSGLCSHGAFYAAG